MLDRSRKISLLLITFLVVLLLAGMASAAIAPTITVNGVLCSKSSASSPAPTTPAGCTAISDYTGVSSSSVLGQSVLWQVQVTGAAGTPTGTVWIEASTDLSWPLQRISATLSSGTALLAPTSLLPVGANAFTVHYSGDATYLAGTQAVSFVVDARANDYTLTPSVTGAAMGVPVTLNSVIKDQAAAAGLTNYGPFGTPGSFKAGNSPADTLYPATALQTDGTVLIFGGTNGGSAVATVQTYTGGVFGSSAVSLSAARTKATATLLQDGKTNLIVGGGVASAEIYEYNPGSGNVSSITAAPPSAVSGHSATLLPNGNVLILGGSVAGVSQAGGFLYHVTYTAGTNAITGIAETAITGTMATARTGHAVVITGVSLPVIQLTILGGDDGTTGTVEVVDFDTSTNTLTQVSSGTWATARRYHSAILLPDYVTTLIAGGIDLATSNPVATTELHTASDATAPAFVSVPGATMHAAHFNGATLLLDGSVLLPDPTSGAATSAADVYIPAFDPVGTVAYTPLVGSDVIGGSNPCTAVITNAGSSSCSVTDTMVDNPGTHTVGGSYSSYGEHMGGGAPVDLTAGAQTITFAPFAPATVPFGTAPITLGATASSGLPITYLVSGPGSEAAGTLIITGAGSITVTATQPGDGVAWSAATPVPQTLLVTAITPTNPTWTPGHGSGITYGTLLDVTDENLTLPTYSSAGVPTPVPGTWAYTYQTGSVGGVSLAGLPVNFALVLDAGTVVLKAQFTPADTTTFQTPAAITTSIVVSPLQLTNTGSWTPAHAGGFVYGTLLTAGDLNATLPTAVVNGATVTVPGTYAYKYQTAFTGGMSNTSLAGANVNVATVLNVGTVTLAAQFTPTSANFTAPVGPLTTSIAISKATPNVGTWTPAPATITYGTLLVAGELNAGSPTWTVAGVSTPVAGSYAYTYQTAFTGGMTPVSQAGNVVNLATVLNAGTVVLKGTYTVTDTIDYNAPAAITANITINKATPAPGTWNPALPAFTYGLQLIAGDLNAAAPTWTVGGVSTPVAGSYAYTYNSGAFTGGLANTPVTGTVVTGGAAPVLNAGTVQLVAAFTVTDTTDYNNPLGATTNITISKQSPVLPTWSPSAPSITYGTALVAGDLNVGAASGTVAGSSVAVGGAYAYTYGTGATTGSPATSLTGTAVNLATILNVGTPQLVATFTPTDTIDYSVGTQTTTITVGKATPVNGTWTPAQSSIPYGTLLVAGDLNAPNPTYGGSTVAGTYAYTYQTAFTGGMSNTSLAGSPVNLATVLNAGAVTLQAQFTPTDTANYANPPAMTAPLTITQVTPTLTAWTPAPASIAYGTQLVPGQLNVAAPTATVAGASTTVAGSYTYTYVTAATYAQPYTAGETATSLNGQVVTTGSSAPALNVPSAALKATFNPTDTIDYLSTSENASITITPVVPTRGAWTLSSIPYGTALVQSEQDGAVTWNVGSQSVNLAGTSTYTYVSGAATYGLTGYTGAAATSLNGQPVTFGNGSTIQGDILNAGSVVMSVDFAPADTLNYLPIPTSTTTLTVTKVTPALPTWTPDNPSITYGTLLDSGDLLSGPTVAFNGATKTLSTSGYAYTYVTASSGGASIAGQAVLTGAGAPVLNAGTVTLQAQYTPADTTNYTAPAAITTSIAIAKATPALPTWTPSAAAINYGSPLVAGQLNIANPTWKVGTLPDGSLAGTTVTVGGTWNYTYGAGITYGGAALLPVTPGATVEVGATSNALNSGVVPLNAAFAQTDTTDFNSLATSTNITINKAPVVYSVVTAVMAPTQLDSTYVLGGPVSNYYTKLVATVVPFSGWCGAAPASCVVPTGTVDIGYGLNGATPTAVATALALTGTTPTATYAPVTAFKETVVVPSTGTTYYAFTPTYSGDLNFTTVGGTAVADEIAVGAAQAQRSVVTSATLTQAISLPSAPTASNMGCAVYEVVTGTLMTGQINCSVSSATASSVSVLVTFPANGYTGAALQHMHLRPFFAMLGLPFFGLVLFGFTGARRKKTLVWMLLVLVVLSMMALTACGGGSFSGGVALENGKLDLGLYVVNVYVNQTTGQQTVAQIPLQLN